MILEFISYLEILSLPSTGHQLTDIRHVKTLIPRHSAFDVIGGYSPLIVSFFDGTAKQLPEPSITALAQQPFWFTNDFSNQTTNSTTEDEINESGLNVTEQLLGSMHPAEAVDLYRAGDELNANGLLRLILPDDTGVCSSSSTMPIKYAINTTTYCAWNIEHSESCNRSLKMKNYFLDYITANAICDRSNDNCFTPILIDYNYNGTTNQPNDCQYLSDMLIDIITQNGVITGFKISFRMQNASCYLNNCMFSTKVSFHEVSYSSISHRRHLSRFDVSEGHLRCPSEVTCLNEFRYFLKLIDYGSSMAQFVSLLPIMIIAVIFVSFKYMF